MTDSAHKALSIYLTTFISFLVGILHFYMARLASRFADVFDGFGAELPLITKVVADSSIYYWFVPTSMVAALVLHHMHFVSKTFIVSFTSLCTLGSIVLCITGFYLPVFQLGAVVE